MKQVWPAAERNKDPILEVLKRILPKSGLVLEVSSGPGQHAAYFAQNLPKLQWQPSDPDSEHRASIEAWRQMGPATNLLSPLDLDVFQPWPIQRVQAVVNINMIHITPWAATEALFRGARRVLGRGDVMFMYGPYRLGAEHTAPSNAKFDASLRERNAEWGVRDLDEVREVAKGVGFHCEEVVQMPANNLSVVYRLGEIPKR